jgi:hypothetical protein
VNRQRDGRAGPDRDRRLNVEVAQYGLIAGAQHVLLD